MQPLFVLFCLHFLLWLPGFRFIVNKRRLNEINYNLAEIIMINFIVRIVFCCSFLFLVSCTHQTPDPKLIGSIVSCTASCDRVFHECRKVCRNNCLQCDSAAAQTTAKNYNRYVCEQQVKGKIVALQLNSFRDPLQCRKTTCSCSTDHQVCIQSCGGVIKKSLKYAPLCS